MNEQQHADVGRAIGQIPSGLFILTARDGSGQTGMLASWVQQVCFQPPMVSVAIACGRPILELIVGSRNFGLCQISKGDKVLMRRFASGIGVDEDPFRGLELAGRTQLDVPILSDSLSYLECEVTHQVDVGGDHDLFIASIVGGGFHGGEPEIRTRTNGFQY